MDESQRRLSGKESPRSGHRLKLVVVLTLALSAAGYAAFEITTLWPAETVAILAVSDCSSALYSGADDTPVCSSVAASTDIPQEQNLDSEATDTANSAVSDAAPESHDRHASAARAWQESSSSSPGLRPGYTMAELCSAGVDDNVLHCQTGSYDTKFYAAGSAGETASTSGFTISGQVLTTEGIGLDGVKVVASPERLTDSQGIENSDVLRFWTMTDTLGVYFIDGLPDGEYTIRSSAHGPYQSARISARAGVDYADLVVSLNSTIVVKGQVLTADGSPLEGVTVLPGELGQPSVLTGDDGQFELPVNLKPTTHSFALRFQRPGFSELSRKVDVRHFATTDGEATNAAAVKIVMQPVESWTELNGTVYSDSGAPLAGRTVELRPLSAQQKYSTSTDSDGQFTFPFIEASNDYRLTVFGGSDHKDYQQPVNLRADTTELDVIVESYEFGEVTGQLVNLNGEPVPDFDLVLRNTGSRQPNALVTSDPFGNFAIAAAPAGEFVVASQSTPSILVRGLHLNPGGKLNLPLVLDWGPHEIHGIVADAQGNPVPASRIILKWSHQANGITTSATRRTAADTQGHFAFSNLGPGPHALQIDAPGYSTVDINHDLSRQGYELTVRLN